MPPTGHKRRSEASSAPTADSSAGSQALSTSNLQDIHSALWTNRLRIEDKVAKQSWPQVVFLAKQLRTRQRNSEMDERSQELALQDRDYYAFTNERTFVAEMWRHMHGDHRNKRTSEEADSVIADAQWTTEAWQVDHLGARWDIDFRYESIPRLENVTPALAKFLESNPRIKNPKPDLAYGIRYGAFTTLQQDIIHTYPRYTEVSPGLCFPFFAAEFKGSQGSMEEADLQACRSGAAMVNGIRELYKEAGREKKDAGADEDSFAFTLALIPQFANLYVHWAEVAPGSQTIYHMHQINTYSLKIATHYQDIRHDLNNILDWGLDKRLNQLKDIVDVIAEGLSRKKQKMDTQSSQQGNDEMDQGITAA